MPSLAQTFLAARGREAADAERLESELARIHREGAAAWPAISIAPGVLAAHLARCLPAEQELLLALETIRCADLFLAAGCASNDAAALAAFDAMLGPTVDGSVRSIDPNPAFLSEVRQYVRQRLLMTEGDAPARIATYSGRGPLHSWLRAVAVRGALNLKEAAPRESPLPGPGLELAMSGGDPEWQLLRSQHHKEFKEAFEGALGSLEPDERTLLRFQVVDGLTTEQIGKLFQVNKGTVSRRLQKARDRLLSQTRRAVAAKLALTPAELDSFMGAVRGSMDVSLIRFLAGP
jgi:RNA polymerase sigma-70 factor, ECF subfamily